MPKPQIVQWQYQGQSYAAEFDVDGSIHLACDGRPLGTAAWSRKRIVDAPSTVPRAVIAWLSQKLRIALLQSSVGRKEVQKSRPSRQEVHELFRYIGLPDVPEGCRQWARVRTRHYYSAFVLPEGETLLFRNWLLVGKGVWSAQDDRIVGYVGDKIPDVVLDRLNRQLSAADD